LFKNTFNFENYLLCIKDRNTRQKYCQIRISAHNLCIESERGIKDTKDRLCKLCLKDVEDEIHFVTDCEFYEKERCELYKKLLDILPDFKNMNKIEKFKIIMGVADCDVVLHTASYIKTCLSIRSELMAKS